MSQAGKKRTITSFFQPSSRTKAPERPSTPVAQSSQVASNTSVPGSSPTQGLSPLRWDTPGKSKAVLPYSRDLEIGASDDDDFSDESLEDLSSILGRGCPEMKATASISTTARKSFETPKAKRTATGSWQSPAPPKRKFDLAALAKDARQDNATEESAEMMNAFNDLADNDKPVGRGTANRNALTHLVTETGADAQKVRRAVQRTEGVGTQVRYCFFDDSYTLPSATPVPKGYNKGPWKLITRADIPTREQHLASGLPMTLLLSYGNLPDELYNWMVDDTFTQESSLIRREFCNLLGKCPAQTRRLMTPSRLQSLFLRLGASRELEDREAELSYSNMTDEPYGKRDWSSLISILEVLRTICSSLSLESIIYTLETLLRMSADAFLLYNMDVLMEYQRSVQAFIECIPRASWDSFCFDTCALLQTIVKLQSLRMTALSCLPTDSRQIHELRRRLAITFLFEDPALSHRDPDEVVTVNGMIDRVSKDDFSVKPDTDFTELRARVLLLDIVIDDGSFIVSNNPHDEKRFNEDIDELALCLRQIWRKINDSGMKLARTEAKSAIECVQQRLTYSVRTRRKVKKSVFDMSEKEDASVPQQQDYMKRFLQRTRDGTPKPAS